MCGIAGFVAGGQRLSLERSLQAMLAAQSHRGPDDEGAVLLGAAPDRPCVGLGNRRLAILDLSPAGHQPMANPDGTAWVTFNGEIYNFRALRKELEARGFRFRSRTDTEVILHGYAAWGLEKLLARLDGMFAFALWDARAQRLFVARDRIGEKPLYYATTDSTFIFASEIRAILASGLVKASLSAAGACAFLALGSVPAPWSMVEPVRALQPGCYLSFDDHGLQLHQYWALKVGEPPRMSFAEAATRLRTLLLDSVSARMVSDVPVGVFLSGGVDSTAILALMRQASDASIKAHSISFPRNGISESGVARLAAKRFGADLEEHEISAEEMDAELPRVITALDQPSIDGVNTYFVSKLTRASGTVVALSGLGGDELFGGYDSFWRIPMLCRAGAAVHALPWANRLTVRALAYADPVSRAGRLGDFFHGGPSIAGAYLLLRGIFRDAQINELLAADVVREGLAALDPLAYLEGLLTEMQARGGNERNAVSLLELRAYMHNQLLRDTDVMSMAHGLEVRCPLIDHQIVEFVLNLPPEWKFRGRRKSFLLNAMGDLVAELADGRSKTGFVFPFDAWFRGPWRETIAAILHDCDDGLIERAPVESVWQSFERGRVHWSRVWALAVLKLWVREFRATARAQPIGTVAKTAAPAYAASAYDC